MYIESAVNETFHQLANSVSTVCAKIAMPSSGGAIEEKVRIKLKDGTSMMGISYKGDVEVWRKRFVGFRQVAGRKYGSIREGRLFLSAMTLWLALSYPFILGALGFWAWQRCRKPSNTGPLTSGQSEASSKSIGTMVTRTIRKSSRRTVLFLTAAAGLLVFCYTDMNHNVGHLSSPQLRDLISRSVPGELNVSLMEGHEHSLFHEYPQMYRYLWVEIRKSGKTDRYTVEVDDATLALIAQKKIACPTYIAGRDFEVLGAPGRFLPFLAAFVLAIGAIFLFKGWHILNPIRK